MKTFIIMCLALLAGCDTGYVGEYRSPHNTYYYPSEPRPVIYPAQNDPYDPWTNQNYWQEQNARREYFESNRPQSMFNHDGSYR